MKFMSASLAALLALQFLAGQDVRNAGPVVQWHKFSGGNDHYYQAVESHDGVTWSEAREIATAQGGYLATLESAAENQFVFKLIDNPKYWTLGGGMNWGPWLGGFRLPGVASPELGWEWDHNSLPNPPMAYSNWAPSEPADSPGEDDSRLQFMSWTPPSRQPTWNNLDDKYALHGLVVEYDTDPALLPETAPPLVVPLLIAFVSSLLIFLAGLYVVFFRQPQQEAGDSPDPPSPTPRGQT